MIMIIYSIHVCSFRVKKIIIKIQKAFRGWKNRKKVEFYKQLPVEIWNKILYFIRYQHYIERYFLKSINRVYSIKINNLYSRMNDIITQHINSNVSSEEIKEYMNIYKSIQHIFLNKKFIIEKIITKDIIIIN